MVQDKCHIGGEWCDAADAETSMFRPLLAEVTSDEFEFVLKEPECSQEGNDSLGMCKVERRLTIAVIHTHMYTTRNIADAVENDFIKCQQCSIVW